MQVSQVGITLTSTQVNQEVERNWPKFLVQFQNEFRQAGIEFKIIDQPLEVSRTKLDNFLGQLGIAGVVFGHIHLRKLLNLDNRIFNVDVDEGDPGHLIFNVNGIEFNAMERSVNDVVVERSEILDHLDGQLARVKEQLGEEVIEEKAEEVVPVRTSRVVQTVPKTTQHKQIKITKARMRQFHQEFRVSWAEGFEFMVRESTWFSGALRVWNIRIGNQEIDGVYIRDPRTGQYMQYNSLLIEEGDTLRIGRDLSSGDYVFVVDRRTFNVTQNDQQQLMLFEREDAIRDENFSLSRSIENRADYVDVNIQSGEASNTIVEPVTQVRDAQEALAAPQTIFNLLNARSSYSPTNINDVISKVVSLINPDIISTVSESEISGLRRDLKIAQETIGRPSARVAFAEAALDFIEAAKSGRGVQPSLTNLQSAAQGVGGIDINKLLQTAERIARTTVSETPTLKRDINIQDLWEDEKGLHKYWGIISSDSSQYQEHLQTLNDFDKGNSVSAGSIVRALIHFTQFPGGVVRTAKDLEQLLDMTRDLRGQLYSLIEAPNDNYGYREKVILMDIGRILEKVLRMISNHQTKMQLEKRISAQPIEISLARRQVMDFVNTDEDINILDEGQDYLFLAKQGETKNIAFFDTQANKTIIIRFTKDNSGILSFGRQGGSLRILSVNEKEEYGHSEFPIHISVTNEEKTGIRISQLKPQSLLLCKEDKAIQDAPKPRFGHSGNKVDYQITQARNALRAGNPEKAIDSVDEAVRLLREVDFEELDASSLPVADMINQLKIALWVVNQLETLGKTNENVKNLTEQLRAGKNGLELKQALGYKKEVGGINFNPNLLDLITEGQSIDFEIPLIPINVENINIDGYVPIIFNITPVTNLSLLLGTSEVDQEELNLAR